MADHGTVEYATATGQDVAKDMVAHEATYDGFVHLAFVGSLHVVNIVLGLAIGAVAGHWGVAFCIFIAATALALYGLAAGAKTPLMVMTLVSLLALALTA
jgi:Bacterial aa3 type cytochrome c oxidase subunit IV